MSILLPLSAAKISAYLRCERYFVDKYIRKTFKSVPNPAAAEGIEKHKFFEEVIKGQPVTKEFPELRNHAEIAASLPGIKHAEVEICVTSDMVEVDWWDKQGFIRGKTDLLLEGDTLTIYDWKFTKGSGVQEAKKYRLEMDIFVFLVFQKYPSYEDIIVELHWFGENVESPVKWKYNRKKDFHRIQRMISGLHRAMEKNVLLDNWPVRPSPLCKGWCDNTGCPAWEPKKEEN